MTEYKQVVKGMVILLILSSAIGYLSVLWWWPPRPTADQIYGCTVEQQAPTGECK